MAARVTGAKSIAYVHGLDVIVDHAIYKAVWLPSIRRMDRVIANSRFTARLCEEAGVSMDRIGIVNPGVTVPPPLHDNDTRARAFRERSEEHTSELQSLMRTSYAVLCMKKKI